MTTAWRLVIHGGAGSMRPGKLDPEQERCARAGLETALAAGSRILEQGERAIDAVEAAVRILEEDPCFNAGRGSVLTAAGCIELEAAIMDGRERQAGHEGTGAAMKVPFVLNVDWIVLLSGKTRIIAFAPLANAPSSVCGTWISLLHCSAPIE